MWSGYAGRVRGGVSTDQTAAPGRTVVVASVPADHVYVRHLSAPGGDAVTRLADPPPAGGAATSQVWWPPVMLDPAWAARADFDVFNLHFGFDAQTPEQLRALVQVLRERRAPLVLTVHDLRNPHHEERDQHDAQLDVLVHAADAVITLTPGAAAEIRSRWGRDALVLPHPHVVDLDRAAFLRRARRQRTGPFRVGVHVKSLRASMDPLRLLPDLARAVRRLPDAVLQVNVHDEVMSPRSDLYLPELAERLRAWEGQDRVELVVHPYFADHDDFVDYLAGLDVSVLPYRFGTHSGWLEACLDVGTRVVAPTCGYYADQAPVLSYRHDDSGYDGASLQAAVLAAGQGEGFTMVPSLDVRRRQRREVAAAHERLYRSLLP